jgi:hypothetical protein
MPHNCKKCGISFPYRYKINGKTINTQRRKFCLQCSPFGSHNSRDLTVPYNPRRKAETYRRWQKKARKERKQKLITLLGGKCEICGYNKSIWALSFHHKDPTQKKFMLSVEGMLTKWDSLVEEIKKCQLLCMNCHAELHEKERHKTC